MTLFKKCRNAYLTLLLLTLFWAPSSEASSVQSIKDYGVRGQVFPIQEHSLLDVIQERLALAQKSGKLKLLQQQFKRRVQEKIAHPLPVKGITPTTEPRTFYFDPILINQKDIKDHLGRVVVPAGKKVNPLETFSWGEPLLFIDGDSLQQITWAQKQTGHLVLVKGRPLTLNRSLGTWVYFDQAGQLCRKLGIKHVPARVSQDGMRLKIEERRP